MIHLKPLLDELKVNDLSHKNSESKIILVFQEHLFIMDDASKLKKIQNVLKKHPMVNKDDDYTYPYDFSSAMSEKAPDILVGEWYPKDEKLVVWNQQDIIPQTSIQVKKTAKQLGVKTVTYRYTDVINGDDSEKDIPVKKLKGEPPKIMYHGTSTRKLTSLLKYGLDASRSESQFQDREVFHEEHVFMAATLETALYYADNAVMVDRRNNEGEESFPIIIELEVPDPDLLAPDFDADLTKGSTPYYDHPVTSPIKTTMKAMGVSRETGKWGYKGRVPSSFFRWIYYYNPYHKKWRKSSPDVWRRLLEKYSYDMEIISWKLGLQGYKEKEQSKYRQFWR